MRKGNDNVISDNDSIKNVEGWNMEVLMEKIEKTHNPSWKIWQQRRWVVAILTFFGYMNAHALRGNLSVAIVAMTENKTVVSEDGSITYMQEFEWDSKIQGYILSSFFYGYITTQILGGWLASRIGGKKIFGVGIASTAALTLLTPLAAKGSFYFVIALRILEGAFEGMTNVCLHAIWAKWAPPFERSRLSSLSGSGTFLGTVISLPVSAYLSDKLGWESVFYFFGSAGLIWFCFWWLIVAESPNEDPKISKAELEYINESLGYTNEYGPVKHPWKSMLLSVPVWAIFVAHFSENWGFFTLLTQLPKFMKDVLRFEIEQTGLMSAIPFLCLSIATPFTGYLADWLLVKGILTTTQVRRGFNCLGIIAQMVFMLAAAHLSSPTGITICLTLAVGFGSFNWPGYMINYLDVGPQHASVLMGIGTTFATLPGILSPIISGYIVTTPNEHEWRIVFYIASAVYLIGCIVYGSFASGELQPWAMDSKILKQDPSLGTDKCHEDASCETILI